MKPTRDDLRVEEGLLSTRKVSPDEFAEIATAEGYVRLDVDVDRLRLAVEARQELFDYEDHLDYLSEQNPIWLLARQVLAALDGEGET